MSNLGAPGSKKNTSACSTVCTPDRICRGGMGEMGGNGLCQVLGSRQGNWVLPALRNQERASGSRVV